MTLEELITETRAQACSLDCLEVLASAARQQRNLAGLGEQLLDHFVQEARAAGCSWSQIGTALGVSKQAAQQRHSMVRSLLGKLKEGVASTRGGMFKRFTSRARVAIVLARDEGSQLRHDYIGTEHLLLGLLAEGEGLAAQALQQAGIAADAARAAIVEIVGPGHSERKGHLPFTPRAKKVMELALRESLDLGHDYIGTEHILLGLIREGQGLAAQVLTKLGTDLGQLRTSVLTLLESGQAPSGTE